MRLLPALLFVALGTVRGGFFEFLYDPRVQYVPTPAETQLLDMDLGLTAANQTVACAAARARAAPAAARVW